MPETRDPVVGGPEDNDVHLPPLGQLDRSLLNILDQVREHCGATRASLFLRDPDTAEAVTRVAHLEEVQEIRTRPGDGIAGAVLARNDILTWPGSAPEPDRASVEATGYQPRTLLALPLRIDDQPVGVLELLDADMEAIQDPGSHARKRAMRMARRLERLLADSSLASQLRPRGERPVSLHYAYEGLIGASPSMRRAFALAARVASTDASVLITGETGTGKELFARALHANSKRSAGPLVKVDCGGIPDTLIENEFFGHERGAFTGAETANTGRFEEANNGTLFLDELGELSLAAQTRLLRVLNDRVVQRLGSGKTHPVDFRLIAATHRDLSELVEEGRFRMDLLHRIKVVQIRLPSLRERGPEDILRLVEHFAQVHGLRHDRPVHSIPAGTQQRLVQHSWPGNVRELSHAVESAVVLSPDGVLTPDLFELTEFSGADAVVPAPGDHPFWDQPTLAELERRYVEWLMERHQGRRLEIARIAGIGRSTLWRRLKEMGYD